MLSMMLMCWNTSHLLARTLETLKNQDISSWDWELLIIDDNSEDDVKGIIEKHGNGLPIKYHRLDHNMGMRGNTFSINYGIDNSVGDVLMWSTPEVMLPPNALSVAYNTARGKKNFITIPSHGLTSEIQLKIDEVDWKGDIHNINKLLEKYPLDDWNQIWFNLNFYESGRKDIGGKKKFYGNNQTVAVDKSIWLTSIGKFPYYLDYGSDDPWISGKRKRAKYTDVTLWEQSAYHQWHTRCQYWMALGKAPNWNKHGHTTSNLMNDPEVPKGGTCEMWDHGDRSNMSQSEIFSALQLAPLVEQTGFKEA